MTKLCSLNKTFDSDQGFTVVELMIVLSLLVVVLSGVYQLFFFAQSSWSRTASESRAIQDTRLVLMQIDREVRQARTPNVSTPPLVSNTSEMLVVYSDVTGDGKPEMVSYRRLGTQGVGLEPLERSVVVSLDSEYPYSYGEPENWVVLIESVHESIFTITGNPPKLILNVSITANDVDSSGNTLFVPVTVQAELAVRSRGVPE